MKLALLLGALLALTIVWAQCPTPDRFTFPAIGWSQAIAQQDNTPPPYAEAITNCNTDLQNKHQHYIKACAQACKVDTSTGYLCSPTTSLNPGSCNHLPANKICVITGNPFGWYCLAYETFTLDCTCTPQKLSSANNVLPG